MSQNMECTQRLECTQDLYGTHSERLLPEQIGFIGICGTKYPVKKGPNKIGRDPQTCSIILNLNSVSRQHAVINILNKKDFMLMDLDSANKTKLSGQTLQPYIPSPLHNGDTVQFGEIFGIFRLLEEEDDLPMTQAIEVLDTPVPMKHSRLNVVTTVPESPDVSDKDDSFIIPSQTKGQHFISPKTRNFIKPGKTISIQPIGTNKIDNIYWNSSKKSTSLNLDDSNTSLNDSKPENKQDDKENEAVNNIHDIETQAFISAQRVNDDSTDSIYTANTQLPDLDRAASSIHTVNSQMPSASSSPSIHSLNTQLPCGISPSIHKIDTQMAYEFGSPTIHNLETQIPPGDLPDFCKIIEQKDVQVDLYANKNDDSIYNAQTQMLKENACDNSNKVNDSSSSTKISNKSQLNIPEEEVLFDDVDNQLFEEQFESQGILGEDIALPMNKLVEPDIDSQSQIIKPKCAKRNMRIKSDSSTDCDDEDMVPTQKILEIKVADDSTDCEEEAIEVKKDKDKPNRSISPKLSENIEDLATQVIEINACFSKTNDVNLEDMPTQVLDVVDIEKDGISRDSNADVDFEDLPTQILKVEPDKSLDSLVNSDNLFKVPFTSPLKTKRKDMSRTPNIKPIAALSINVPNNTENDFFYQDTQDIYDDLCTQKLDSKDVMPEIIDTVDGKPNPEELLSPKTKLEADTSFSDIDAVEKVGDFLSNLSSQEVRDVIGIDSQVSKVTKIPSDGSTASDVDVTPKKLRPYKLMDIDLPNSQEIKTSVSLSTRSVVTESSSDSEPENNSEEQCTPILFRKAKISKSVAKLDLTKKFNIDALPSRIITRVRKPTAKIQDPESKKVSENILKPKFLGEQEGDIDKDIITENISRLKSNNEKFKMSKNNNCNEKSKELITAPQKVKFTEKARIVTEESDSRNNIEKYETNFVAKSSEKSKELSEDEKKIKSEPKSSKKETIGTKYQSSTNKNKQSLDSTSESKPTTHSSHKLKEVKALDLSESLVEAKRITRSNRKTKKDKTQEKNAALDCQSKEPPKRKYTRKQVPKEEEKEPSPKKEIRRSRRQRTVKIKLAEDSVKEKSIPMIEKKEESVKIPKSILKKNTSETHEESTVYNVSSGSNSDTSRSFKRPALDDSETPSSKRLRSVAINNVSLRATPSRKLKTQYVLFTAFPFEAVKVKLEKMGAVIVTDVMKSTVLLTQQIKRTFKLLCAVGLGKPIVGPSWVQACADTNMIVDPWLYLMKDEVAEKRFHFSLEKTLKGKRNFLKGYNVSSTPKVLPEAHEMKLIVECSGGTWKEGGAKWVCISVPQDMHLWAALKERGATVVSAEFILGGVLRQKVDIEINRYK